MRLITLGQLTLEGLSDFNRHKPLLLLSFLALEGAKSRRYLAELFYFDTKDPLNSLSRALSHLRNAHPKLIATDENKVWTPVPCDAKALTNTLDKRQFEEALALYKGPFLEGLSLSLNTELEEWLYITRETLAGRMRETQLRLGELAAKKKWFDDAASHAEQAYKLAGAPELEPENFRRVYSLLVVGGHPRASHIREEAKGFGIDLLLSQQQARALFLKSPKDSETQHNLPSHSTSFVGRETELGVLQEQLTNPNCRLLTILGPGGIGKSRLVTELATKLLESSLFPEGIFFVALDALRKAEDVPTSIADALGLELAGQEDTLAQLKSYLASKQVLLVLDNIEHLLDATPLLTELLEVCPKLRFLLTSREKLRLEEEWVFFLDGLPLPTATADDGSWQAAVLQLFVDRAKRARLSFALTPEELPYVLSICKLVDGSPLGIELAAAWVKMLSPADIAQEIRQSLSFLESSTRNSSKRHQSIQAAFESSWQRLNKNEQAVLRKLSVFRGGFRKDAATDIADASLPILSSLIDKSLLRVTTSGRYDRHALLFQYSQEKLQDMPDEQMLMQSRHAAYFHSYLKTCEQSLQGPLAKEAMDGIEEDLENIRLAWSLSIDKQDNDALLHSSTALKFYFDRRAYFQEGVALFEQGISALDKTNPDHRKILGVLLLNQAWLVQRQGKTQEAERLTKESLYLLRQFKDHKRITEGLVTLGALSWQTSDYLTAKRYWQEALELAQQQKDAARMARLADLLGIIEERLGNLDNARNYHETSLAQFETLGNQAAMVTVYNNLGTLEVNANNLSAAHSLLEKGLALAQNLGLMQDQPYLLNNLAKVALKSEDAMQALQLSQKALDLARTTGDKAYEAKILDTLGNSELKQSNFLKAHQHFKDSLVIASSLKSKATILQVFLSLSQLYQKQNQIKKALLVLEPILHDSASPKDIKQQAQERFSSLDGATLERDSQSKLSLAQSLEAILKQEL